MHSQKPPKKGLSFVLILTVTPHRVYFLVNMRNSKRLKQHVDWNEFRTAYLQLPEWMPVSEFALTIRKLPKGSVKNNGTFKKNTKGLSQALKDKMRRKRATSKGDLVELHRSKLIKKTTPLEKFTQQDYEALKWSYYWAISVTLSEVNDKIMSGDYSQEWVLKNSKALTTLFNSLDLSYNKEIERLRDEAKLEALKGAQRPSLQARLVTTE